MCGVVRILEDLIFVVQPVRDRRMLKTTSVQSWSVVACHRFGRAEQAEHPSDPFSEAAVLGATKAVASHRTPRSLFGRLACSPWFQSSLRDERVMGGMARGLKPTATITASLRDGGTIRCVTVCLWP
jgi:hypothetical protein